MDKGKKISSNFWEYEFDFIIPHPDLINLLQQVRDHLNKSIKITSAKREIEKHISIYKKKYGEKWPKKIPWNSRHLPSFECPYLRAVDFKVLKYKKNGIKIYMSGVEIKEHIQLVKPENLHLGLGVGNTFIHLDVNREREVERSYNY